MAVESLSGFGTIVKSVMMKRFMLSCQAATGLMEKKHREKLSFGEKMELLLHTAMCGACRRYEKQSRFLENLFRAKQEDPGLPVLEENT